MLWPDTMKSPEGRPLLHAADLLRQGGKSLPELPSDAILLFQKSALDGSGLALQPMQVPNLPGGLYRTRGKGSAVAVLANPGAGAPAAVIALELLAACGVRRLVAIGMAGGLQPDLQPGALVLCERAIREEGTSFHYLPPSESVRPSASLKAALATALKSGGATFQTGTSWSCDAPFRETFEKATRHAAAGALVVEMEAAGLFAAGQHLGIQVAALFSVADGMRGDREDCHWRMDFDPQKVRGGLITALLAAIQAFQTPLQGAADG
jgi:uridine phosphorylase